jgi:membrane-associated protease RseP (regulator of RpoE activity)
VAEATPGSAAALAGIHIGDRVVSVDGTPVSTFEEMSEQVRRRPGETVDIVVLRNGEEETISTQLGARASLIGTIGQDLAFGAYDGEVRVNSIAPSSRAGEAGLRDGDLVRAINGVPLTTLADLKEVVADSDDGTLAIEFEGKAGTRTEAVDLGTDVDSTTPTGFFGVGSKTVDEDVNPIEAGGRAFQTFGRGVVLTVQGVGKVFNPANLASFASKTVQPETTNDDRPTPAADSQVASASGDLDRPVSIIGIVGLGNQLTNVQAFLLFLAGVNLTIGVINLIPLLPFDGGHVAVACYEKIRELIRGDGKRYFVDANKLMAPTYAVVIIMVFVGLLAGYSDIVRPIQL